MTLSAAEEAVSCSQALGALAAGLPQICVLATARSDFLSRLEALPGFRDRVSRHLFLLAPLGPDEIREAVVGPAAVVGTRFESSELVDELVTSTVAEGTLPLLQFTLTELWERRDRSRNVIAADTLREMGGVSGALSRHADKLLLTLSEEERAAAKTLLLPPGHRGGHALPPHRRRALLAFPRRRVDFEPLRSRPSVGRLAASRGNGFRDLARGARLGMGNNDRLDGGRRRGAGGHLADRGCRVRVDAPPSRTGGSVERCSAG